MAWFKALLMKNKLISYCTCYASFKNLHALSSTQPMEAAENRNHQYFECDPCTTGTHENLENNTWVSSGR